MISNSPMNIKIQPLIVGFPIGNTLRGIVRNCVELRGIVHTVRAHEIKSTGNPYLIGQVLSNLFVSKQHQIHIEILKYHLPFPQFYGFHCKIKVFLVPNRIKKNRGDVCGGSSVL